MENASYIALSRQVTLERSLDLVANNIANANTVGFKGQHMLFEEHLQELSQGNSFDMVNDYGQFMDMKQGPFQDTGNPLDLALEGEGFFQVETPQGLKFTRSGSFQLNAQREIVNENGFIVTNRDGRSITVPQEAENIFITEKGNIFANGAQIDQIGVFEFDKPQELQQEGNGLYAANGAVKDDAENTNVVQGAIEQSNIQPILEITKMLKITRAYQSTNKVLETEHERQRGAIRKLGDVNS